jgi:hypothetical protein
MRLSETGLDSMTIAVEAMNKYYMDKRAETGTVCELTGDVCDIAFDTPPLHTHADPIHNRTIIVRKNGAKTLRMRRAESTESLALF